MGRAEGARDEFFFSSSARFDPAAADADAADSRANLLSPFLSPPLKTTARRLRQRLRRAHQEAEAHAHRQHRHARQGGAVVRGPGRDGEEILRAGGGGGKERRSAVRPRPSLARSQRLDFFLLHNPPHKTKTTNSSRPTARATAATSHTRSRRSSATSSTSRRCARRSARRAAAGRARPARLPESREGSRKSTKGRERRRSVHCFREGRMTLE